MTITIQKAKRLCSTNELNLVHWSTRKRVEDLPPSRLQEKIARARKLRDKYRDLVKQQRGEARGKRKARSTRPAQSAENTKIKAQLFDETLDRFQTALKEKQAEQNAPSGNTTGRKKSGRKKTGGGKKKTARKKKTGRKKKATPRVALAASRRSTKKKKASLSASPRKKAGVGTGLGKSSLSARQTRRKATSKRSTYKREESRFQRTSREKIQGHVSGQTKRNQARRDARQG